MTGRVLQLFADAPAPATDFDEFWRVYPRREAKQHARRMWQRLGNHDRAAAMAALPLHVAYWRSVDRDREKIPHPGTWINGRRWEDELPGALTGDALVQACREVDQRRRGAA